MIDFRYHLVSLVSVFLALAVGIVLGAGPLKDPISEGLSQSVQGLRQDLDNRNNQLKTSEAAVRNRDTFITQVSGDLIANRLPGRSVVLVTLPGADVDAVRPLTEALTAAGAKVTGRVDVQEAWVDPAVRPARDAAIAALRATAGTGTQLPTPRATSSPGASATPSRTVPGATTGTTASGTPGPSGSPSGSTPAGTSADAAAARVLARALVTRESSPSERPDAVSRTLLEGLGRAGLVDVNGDVPGRATQAVLLVPGVEAAVQGAATTPSPTASAAVLPAWTTLATVLDDDSAGAVVVGPASAATQGGVIAAVRTQLLPTGVSTVDTGSTPMGDVTAVLALREQGESGAGNYGYGDGAKAVLPGLGGG